MIAALLSFYQASFAGYGIVSSTEQRSSDRQADRLGREVESVPVHASFLIAQEAQVRDE